MSLLWVQTIIAANSKVNEGLQYALPKNDHGNVSVKTELTGTAGVFATVADTLVYLAGALAVIVLIYGGLRYVTSTGDASRVKAAKDTIIYGIVGLVVAILAYAIVKFVVSSITN